METNGRDPEAQRHFLVELSSPDGGWDDLALITARARAAAGHVRDEGLDVAFIRSVYAPESEALFLVYRAATPEQVVVAARRARLSPATVSVALNAADGGGP